MRRIKRSFEPRHLFILPVAGYTATWRCQVTWMRRFDAKSRPFGFGCEIVPNGPDPVNVYLLRKRQIHSTRFSDEGYTPWNGGNKPRPTTVIYIIVLIVIIIINARKTLRNKTSWWGTEPASLGLTDQRVSLLSYRPPHSPTKSNCWIYTEWGV